MKIYNRKKKEWVEIKEFIKQWKEGMQRVTPYQQTLTSLFGQLISLVGVIWGIVFSIIIHYWWMMVILIGGLIVLGTQILGTWQKKVILKQIDDSYKKAETESILVTSDFSDLKEVSNGITELS